MWIVIALLLATAIEALLSLHLRATVHTLAEYWHSDDLAKLSHLCLHFMSCKMLNASVTVVLSEASSSVYVSGHLNNEQATRMNKLNTVVHWHKAKPADDTVQLLVFCTLFSLENIVVRVISINRINSSDKYLIALSVPSCWLCQTLIHTTNDFYCFETVAMAIYK